MAKAKTPKTVAKKAATSVKGATKSSKVQSSKPKTLKDISTMISDKKNKKIAYIIFAVILIGAVVYALKGFVIAAMVNGEPVSRLTVISELEKQSGKAALDAIITRKLIVQEAQKKNIVVSQKDIDAEVKKIESQFAGQGQKLDDLLVAQGLSKTKFLDEVRIQLRKFHDILNDEAKAAEYILSFDDEDALSLLYYLEENKEIIHDLLPSKEEDEEFEIGPNGQLIIKGQGQERTKLSNIETRIPDIRTLARTKISDVEARIPYADANFFQITGAFQGLGMKDIHAAVNEGLVKPHKASEGREAFYKHEVAMILARKDLRKFSLTKNMKKEMSEIFEDELRKFEDELKKKD